jgi:hypothetical protein
MLNIEVNRSAEGVERYFDRELAVSDYLMKEPGVWAGRGAERLGLRGPVEPTATPQPTSLVGRQLSIWGTDAELSMLYKTVCVSELTKIVTSFCRSVTFLLQSGNSR